MDVVDSVTRSRMMSGIRGKDTKPELLVRKALHGMGFRYRLHDTRLPGRPDIVLPRYKAVVLIHGCFWHGHDCRFFKLPSTRSEFWHKKIARNRANDLSHLEELKELGWREATVWECALRKPPDIDATVDSLAQWLRGSSPAIEIRG